MDNSIIVLSQQHCRPCSFVKSYLDSQNVNYDVIDVQENNEYVEKYGIMSTPVTILLDDSGNELIRVSGYNPNDIQELIEQL
jgi:thioredoxin 1